MEKGYDFGHTKETGRGVPCGCPVVRDTLEGELAPGGDLRSAGISPQRRREHRESSGTSLIASAPSASLRLNPGFFSSLLGCGDYEFVPYPLPWFGSPGRTGEEDQSAFSIKAESPPAADSPSQGHQIPLAELYTI